MAGKTTSMSKGWELIKTKISLDPSTPLGNYLGCGQADLPMSVTTAQHRLKDVLPLLQKADGFPQSVALAAPQRTYRCNKITAYHTEPAADRRGGETHASHIRAIRYDMEGFVTQCIDRYLEASGSSESSLKTVQTPGLADSSIPSEDYENPGRLAPAAASVLMKILCVARSCRFDLLHPVNMLAR